MFSSIATAALLTTSLATGGAAPDPAAQYSLAETTVTTSVVEYEGVAPLAITDWICGVLRVGPC